MRSEAGGAGRTALVSLLVLAVLGLIAAVLYLVSDINHRQYRLAVQEGNLLVQRGRMFPFGFKRFEPEANDLKAAYAPTPVPPGISLHPGEIYEDRADIDRALFTLLASWTRNNLESDTPGAFELATSYVRRCELLPGLSEEQRIELRTLRADLAYRGGRKLLNTVTEQLQKALTELQLAKKLGTRQKDVDAWIADVERRIRDYQTPRDDTPVATDPTAPPLPAPPVEAPEGDESNPPTKWRL